MPEESSKQKSTDLSRRDFMAKVLMGIGLLLAYGALAVEGILFILPPKKKTPTRNLFAGKLEQYRIGTIQTFYDLEGKQILVKRDESGLRAFSSVCPHLGCRVHWDDDNRHFLCPCHGGIFNEEGVATAGPPADAAQNLIEVPIHVDEASGIVYIEVKDPGKGKLS
jgi:cytochrome b6-f complex iron-sulfur subunit